MITKTDLSSHFFIFIVSKLPFKISYNRYASLFVGSGQKYVSINCLNDSVSVNSPQSNGNFSFAIINSWQDFYLIERI